MTAGRLGVPVAVGALALGLGVLAGFSPWLAVAAGGAVALGLVGTTRPDWLVPLVFLAMLFDQAGVTGAKVDEFPVTASKLAVLGTISAWVLHALLRGVSPFRWHPVLGAMLTFLASTAVCVAASNSLKYGKFTLFGLVMMLMMVAVVYAILLERTLDGLFRFVAACLVVALAIAVIRSGGAGESGRATGTMGDPNEWATMVLLLVPTCLGALGNDDHSAAPALRLGLLLLGPLAVLASGSRSALVVGLVVFPGSLLLLRRRAGEIAAAGVIGLVAAPFLVDPSEAVRRFSSLWARFSGNAPAASDDSLSERAELFRQGVALFVDHWFTGAGPGMFSRATGFVSHTGRFRPAHNTYLEIAGEQGIVGLLTAAIFIVVVGLALRRGLLAARDEAARARVMGVSLGLFAVAAMAATLGLLTFAMAYLVLGLALAVVKQAERGLVR